MTGLPVDTLRAWERRYKVVTPERSSRGRLYGNADVRRLNQLRAAVALGYAIGEAAAVSEAELQALIAREQPAPAEPPATVPDKGRIDGLIGAAVALDSTGLDEELGRLATLLSPAEFVHQVVVPLMSEAGERWHAGTLQAAQEHLVTGCIRNLLGTMVRLNRSGGAQRGILATTPAGELHELGVLAGAMLAGARGFPVAYLGPNLPAGQILFAADRIRPQVILLGMTTPNPAPSAGETVCAVASALPPETELWLGGPGVQGLSLPEQARIVRLADFPALERNLARLHANAAPARSAISSGDLL